MSFLSLAKATQPDFVSAYGDTVTNIHTDLAAGYTLYAANNAIINVYGELGDRSILNTKDKGKSISTDQTTKHFWLFIRSQFPTWPCTPKK